MAREKTQTPLVTFRVHFADGQYVDAMEESPAAARAIAVQRLPGGIITKIKVVMGL